MRNDLRLWIMSGALAEMHRLAASVPNIEIIGLLAAAARQEDLVTTLCLLPAAASGASATASGTVIRSAIERLRLVGKVPVGVFHSHARFSVFHSATDDRMIERFFPTLASACMQTISCALEPQIVDQDRAHVATANGQLLQVQLRGETMGGGIDRSAWTFARLAMHPPREPQIRYEHPTVEIIGQRSTIELGVPDAATVEISAQEYPHRCANLHSVVVNAKAETFVECVTILDINGRNFIERQVVEIETVESKAPAATPNRQFLLYRDEQSVDGLGHERSSKNVGGMERQWTRS